MDEVKFPIGTEGRFTYHSMSFDGEVAGYDPNFGHLIKVYRGTGHEAEEVLHDGSASEISTLKMETKDYWFVGPGNINKTVVYNKIKPYDPTQGNEEDDI